jgi:hypothetical protein
MTSDRADLEALATYADHVEIEVVSHGSLDRRHA